MRTTVEGRNPFPHPCFFTCILIESFPKFGILCFQTVSTSDQFPMLYCPGPCLVASMLDSFSPSLLVFLPLPWLSCSLLWVGCDFPDMLEAWALMWCSWSCCWCKHLTGGLPGWSLGHCEPSLRKEKGRSHGAPISSHRCQL